MSNYRFSNFSQCPRVISFVLTKSWLLLLLSLLFALPGAEAGEDRPLSSWKDGKTRSAIIDFVRAVTEPSSRDYTAEADRVAVFDNDGTLWCEKPYYPQLTFAIDRAKISVGLKPGDIKDGRSKNSLKRKSYSKSGVGNNSVALAVKDDVETLVRPGALGTVELLNSVHAGMTTDDYEAVISSWLKDARHPRFNQPYTSCVYKPMLELLEYLRAHGFKTFIVSGGSIEFMRPWTERVYGIPPEQVVGSTCKLKYQVVDGKPSLVRSGDAQFVDDRAGKPVGIYDFIGRKPLAAFGNSDGDLEMLEWTASLPGRRLAALVHHTDDKREYAYDRLSFIGRLDKALQEAKQHNWLVIDMKNDWSTVFPFNKADGEQ